MDGPDAEMRAPPRPNGTWLLLVGLIATLFLVMGAVAIAVEYRRAVEARGKLVLSYQRRIMVADLLSGLKDAETAGRGYIITGDRAYLASYAPTLATISRQRRAMAALLVGVPRQGARYAELSRAIDAEIAGLNRLVAAGAGRGPQGARHSVGETHGAMDRARRAAATMTAEEDRMIATRARREGKRIAAVQIVLGLLIAILAALGMIGLLREWRGRRSRFQLETDAQSAEVRLRGVFAATSDAVALIGPDGVIEAVNPAVVRLVGRPADTLVGQDIALLIDAVPPAGTFVDRLGLIDGQLCEPIRIDQVAHHADGHDVPVDVALGLMPVPSGLHVVAAIRDVSERKRLERIKDEFVATVSHELRTPLTSIVGALGLLRGTAIGSMSDVARRLVQVAEDNSQRLIDLINDLLDMEKIEAGGLRFQDRPLDLAAMLREVAHRSEALATVHGVRIVLEIAPDTLPVRGDAGRLAQVTTNLLANAVRFSPRGGTVTMAAMSRDGQAVVTVDDRGPGVPEAFRDQLFTRFAQSENGGRAVGTGLGLAISRQIVRAHGGTIWFEPRPGGGARFGFAVALRGASAKVPHLLICAQDQTVVCGLRGLADTGGCSADRVATVEDARAAIESGAYDAVLVDLEGEDATGSALLDGLAADARDGRLPVPVVARIGGAVRLGTAGDPGSWDSIEPADGVLAARIDAVPDGGDRMRPLIIHIDGNAPVIDRTAEALRRRARLRRGADADAVAAVLERERPALLILDQDRGDGSAKALLTRIAGWDGPRVATILYSRRPVTPEMEALVDCVVTETTRSSPALIGAVDRLLARGDVETGADAGGAPPHDAQVARSPGPGPTDGVEDDG